ncbi:MAG: hypothetical protein HXS50_00330, partial [Theionarchaea archaeon]|nr:hypothetical protein [Theionarchaea archaeon]
MRVDDKLVEELYGGLAEGTRSRVDCVVEQVCSAKEEGGRICVVTGSGPNLHEGVTTLIAELIRKGIVDGVSTSSAVVAHEMAGCLERVYRVDGVEMGMATDLLPADGKFEITLCGDDVIERLSAEMDVDRELMQRARDLPGDEIIKAAGNMSYPVGLRTERISREICRLARSRKSTFEEIAGAGSDPRTMIGAGAEMKIPVLVTVPQLVGGGSVGMDIADSTEMRERSRRIADLLARSDVIIESALALAQEVHDGPYETYTGHGIWSGWDGEETYRLLGKRLVRIDLDSNLELAWQKERESSRVQEAVAKGLPKTKLMGIPFRMEMSGFARLPGSLPIVGDIGVIWPII